MAMEGVEMVHLENNNAVVNGVGGDEIGGSRWWEFDGPVPSYHDNSGINRHWFPKDFVFGSGTAAFQVEGAATKGGKGISIWDEFSMRLPWKIADGSNGSLACDMYNRYKEDIQMMKHMGFDAYRFSISWPRILPAGRVSGGINKEGIAYYNDVINTVLHHGMKPFVTLFHWDLPVCLEKEYGGFLSKRVKDDFREFAEVCFWEFGDRVKQWSTLNEPWTYAVNGYVRGSFPPGHKVPVSDDKLATKIPPGRGLPLLESAAGDKFVMADPSEAYTVGRNLLLAHAEAVDLYRSKFQEAQGGEIGIVLNSHWFTPFDEHSVSDASAATRGVDFMFGWFLEPILYGHYPQSMEECVPPDNLASFTQQERRKLQGSLDFLGLNYYTTQYASDDPHPADGEGYFADQRVKYLLKKGDEYIGTPSGSVWLHSVPKGIYEILIYLDDKYPELKEIYITENGFSTKSDHTKTAKMVCDDDHDRTKYHQDHLANMLKAMKHRDISNKLKGYFVWSWCDNFEWGDGYTVRFGLVYVDYMNELTRYPKNSAAWFAKFLKSKGQPPAWFHPWWVPRPLSQKRAHPENVETDKRLKLVETINQD
ncbi:beta-glucosidase 12-like [Salvia miltiorrhiza]|uniref:beta-glucosidase 12-like n=1 Tax=Salvia miltiorrhiza TaxID=226208 RepID=UPI0025AC38E2|nr:beta-glucosidase 12-like [Salvia miltiorrhiza]XP_057806388.1 beta-glucosidase 12-like [Salvia miltiorrhiza]